MEMRRLGVNDYPHLEEIISVRAATKKFVNTFMNDDKPVTVADEEEYKTRWLAGMQKWYLTDSVTHDLYGAFSDDGVLLSCMSWRSDLPGQWSDGWVVGNLKARPGHSFMNNGILPLWKKMFEVCENKGLKRWHMLIIEGNRNKYQAIADRYLKDIDDSYSYEWTFIVPPNMQPTEDWVWGTMGRNLLNKEIRVRTGTKK